jgi:hypothetical protein
MAIEAAGNASPIGRRSIQESPSRGVERSNDTGEDSEGILEAYARPQCRLHNERLFLLAGRRASVSVRVGLLLKACYAIPTSRAGTCARSIRGDSVKQRRERLERETLRARNVAANPNVWGRNQ